MRMVMYCRQLNLMTGQAEVSRVKTSASNLIQQGSRQPQKLIGMTSEHKGCRNVHVSARDAPGTNKWFLPGGMYEKGASVEAAHCTAQRRHHLTERADAIELSVGIARAMEPPSGHRP